MTYAITWEANGVYVKFGGVLTGQDLIAKIRDIWNGKKLRKIRYKIIDYSEVTSIDINVNEQELLDTMFYAHRLTSNGLNLVVIGEYKNVLTDIQLKVKSFRQRENVVTFNSVDDARAWIADKWKNSN